MRTHEYEPIPGLPEEPPEDEEVLWQGRPAWWSLTKRAFHVRKIGLFFVIVGALYATDALMTGQGVAEATGQLVSQLLIGALAIGLLSAIGWWMAESTVYTITNRRVVMRIGAALPMNVNLPYARVEEANVRHHRDGTSDITLRLFDTEKVRFLLFWPHARPWHWRRPEPAMRVVPDGDRAARVLAEALEAERAREEASGATAAGRSRGDEGTATTHTEQATS